MLKETLHTYRQERKAFIYTLKNYFDINFYNLDIEERNAWLYCYLEMRREFIEMMMIAMNEMSKKSKKR
jgi:hypothetical protein